MVNRSNSLITDKKREKHSVIPQHPHVAIITLGCAKNEVDSAAMAKRLTQAGFTMVENPLEAHAIIINTCSFIQSATEESLEAIFDAADLPNVADGTPLIVSGCMPARYGDELADELTEASAFVPCDKEANIVAIVADQLNLALDEHGKLDTSTRVTTHESTTDESAQTTEITISEQSVSAYVKISDGCDRFCSYCTIPFIRGRYHSFLFEKIYEDVAEHVNNGVREIVLIAQDTGRWGKDFEEQSSLAHLMTKLAESFPTTWFRVMYLQPEGITDELLNTMARHDNICSYLDIPLQHVDPAILHAMNRKGSRLEYEDLIHHINELVPDITLRTTLIAGFPGETEEAFNDLLDFVSEGYFDYVGVFAYSQEDGTKAAMLPDQIDEDEKQDRAQQLRESADAVSASRIAERIGKTIDILVEGFEEDGQCFGRGMCQAPEVDGVTYITSGTPGEIKSITIADTLFYEMEGE